MDIFFSGWIVFLKGTVALLYFDMSIAKNKNFCRRYWLMLWMFFPMSENNIPEVIRFSTISWRAFQKCDVEASKLITFLFDLWFSFDKYLLLSTYCRVTYSSRKTTKSNHKPQRKIPNGPLWNWYYILRDVKCDSNIISLWDFSIFVWKLWKATISVLFGP
jgi:hypothetical protein